MNQSNKLESVKQTKEILLDKTRKKLLLNKNAHLFINFVENITNKSIIDIEDKEVSPNKIPIAALYQNETEHIPTAMAVVIM